MNQVHRRIKRTPLVMAALIAALLLAGIAYAAVRSQILDRLFSGSQPSKQAEELVQPVKKSITKEGITVTFDEVIVDGESWYLGYEITSERADTVLYTTAWGSSLPKDDALLDKDDWSMGIMGGSVGGAEMPRTVNGVMSSSSISIADIPTPDEPFEVMLCLRVAHPKMELVLWDKPSGSDFETYAPISKKEWKQYKESKQIPVYGEGYTEFPKWITDINDAEKIGIMKLGENAGCVESFLELTLTATIDPATAPRQTHMRLAEAKRFELDEYAVEVDMVDLTPLTTDIRFEVIPNLWQDESGLSEGEYAARFYRDYDLLNGNGERILSSRYGIACQRNDWAPAKSVSYSCKEPLTELPNTLIIAPIIWQGEGVGRTIQQYDMDHAVTLELAQTPAAPKATARPLPDIGAVAKAFFGAEAERLKAEEPSLEGGEQLSDLAFNQGDHIDRYIEFDRVQGKFSMGKPSSIEMAGFEFNVSATPGKYTQDEAVALAEQFLSEMLGIDTALLTASVTPESERKSHSLFYEIVFEYRCDGLALTGRDKDIHVDVTDDGVIRAQGYSLGILKP